MAKKLDRLYIRTDALFPSDERYQALDYKLRDSAYLFFLALNGWSRDKKTDGRIPLANARAIGRAMEHPAARVDAFLAALAAPAVSIVRIEGDDVLLPTYSKWQDTKEEIEGKSEARRSAGRAGGMASGRSRREANASPPLHESSSNREANASPSVEANAKQNEAETETETETESDPSLRSGSRPAEPVRADVDQLCRALADSVEERGERRPQITAEWRKQARLLLDSDRRPLDEALVLIAWAAQDRFWSANVLSIPTFRQQYAKLRLQREREARPPAPAANGRPAPAPRHQLDAETRAAYTAASKAALPS